MKVMHSNKYDYVGIEDGWFKFESNPNFEKFDPEIVLVKRVRYVTEDENGKVTSKILVMDSDELVSKGN